MTGRNCSACAATSKQLLQKARGVCPEGRGDTVKYRVDEVGLELLFPHKKQPQSDHGGSTVV
jgi:hypothetical protein